MEETILNNTQQTLLQFLSNVLTDKKKPITRVENWEDVIIEATKQAVSALALQGAAQSDIPPEFLEVWKGDVLRRLPQSMWVHAQHDRLHRLMREHQIPYCILKGSASAWYYPDPALRQMGDVDFLVAKADVPRAAEVLEREGLTSLGNAHVCHIVFVGDSTHMELHFELAGMPEGEKGDVIRGYLSDVFERAEPVQDATGWCFIKPGHFHHGLILILHTYHHMLAEGIGLRHLCDFAVFLDSLSDAEFQELFEKKLQAVGLWRFVQLLGQTVHKYLHIEYRPWMGVPEDELCDAIIQDVFTAGNFGRKEQGRAAQGAAFSSRGKNGVQDGKIRQILCSMNDVARYQFPWLQRRKYLKHFCWVPFGIRYLFRVLCGKRKLIPLRQTLQRADERKEIYKQFRLFETEDVQEVEHE